MPAVATPEVVQEIKIKRANQQWLDQHREDLRAKYADRYVAVFDGQVVAAGEDFPTLLATLRKAIRGKSPSLAAIELIGKDEFVWVL